MKILRRLFAVTIGFVVGMIEISAGQFPDTLPYGANFPSVQTFVDPVIWRDNGDGSAFPVGKARVQYAGGSLQSAVQSAVTQLGKTFSSKEV